VCANVLRARRERRTGVLPFLQFRLWIRRGPLAERALTTVAGCLALALLAWFVPSVDSAGLGRSTAAAEDLGAPAALSRAAASDAPGSGTAISGSVTAGATQGNGGAAAAPGSITSRPGSGGGAHGVGRAQGPGAAPAAGAVPGRTTASTPSACGPSTAPGVTSSTITLGVIVIDVGEAGVAFNVPSGDAMMKAYNALAAYYNAHGGVACRKLVLRFFRDTLVAETEHSQCLDIVQAQVYAVVGNMFNPTETTCLAQRHIPNIWFTPPHVPNLKQYYPYIMSFAPNYDRLIKDYVFGAKKAGWFSGLNKLGVTEETCYPDKNEALAAALAAAGIAKSQVETFVHNCATTGPIPPSDHQSAALQFKRDGVTHVMTTAFFTYSDFSRAADQQDFHPKYAIYQDAQMDLSERSQNPPGSGFDGALGITTDQIGAQNTPGVRLSPATAQCTKTLTAVGSPAPTKNVYFGHACGLMAMFAAAANRAPALERTKLAVGVSRIGPLDLPFQAGPANFANVADPTGGHFWRPARFNSSCNCWKVASAAWNKGYV
jgi:hypothetical protein